MSIHLGIIPDGNRRWSKMNNKSIVELLDKIRDMVMKSIEHTRQTPLSNLSKINAITVYVLSKDNLIKRNDQTLDMIRHGLDLVLQNAAVLMLSATKIQFIGEIESLPPDIRQKCAAIEALSSTTPDCFVLTVGIGYDPIMDVTRIVNNDPKRPSQRHIDMVIRTGGEIRSSGFFPLQTLYSEWFYLSKLIPDLTFGDIDGCIEEYLSRNRRFGA